MKQKSGTQPGQNVERARVGEKTAPRPWRFHLGRGATPRFHIQTEGGYQIASTTELVRHSQAYEENAMREANAAHIVKCVNAHDEMVELLKEATTVTLMEKNPALASRILRVVNALEADR